METAEAKSPNVKSAVSFFNSLSRQTSLEVRRVKIESSEVRVHSLIPRAKLRRAGSVTPDVEAKRIIDDFNRKISPYNTFKLRTDALDTDFFRTNLQHLLPDVVSREIRKRRRYQKPNKRCVETVSFGEEIRYRGFLPNMLSLVKFAERIWEHLGKYESSMEFTNRRSVSFTTYLQSTMLPLIGGNHVTKHLAFYGYPHNPPLHVLHNLAFYDYKF
jgi:hypothetical protein